MSSPENFEYNLTPEQIARDVFDGKKIPYDVLMLLKGFKRETDKTNKPLKQFIGALSALCKKEKEEFDPYVEKMLLAML